MNRACGFAALAAICLSPGTTALAAEPLEYARCAGVTDAMFDSDDASGDAEYLDAYATQAHVFMVIARRLDGAKNAAALHLARIEGRQSLSRPGMTDDDIHTEVQYCSDLHQELQRAGLFKE